MINNLVTYVNNIIQDDPWTITVYSPSGSSHQIAGRMFPATRPGDLAPSGFPGDDSYAEMLWVLLTLPDVTPPSVRDEIVAVNDASSVTIRGIVGFVSQYPYKYEVIVRVSG